MELTSRIHFQTIDLGKGIKLFVVPLALSNIWDGLAASLEDGNLLIQNRGECGNHITSFPPKAISIHR